MIDRIIAGRYKILKHIGRGGMQEVFLAHDTELDTEVALKTPQAGQQNRRFQKSAIISARINHHHVAKTLDYIDENGTVYLIEELINGETLSQKLDRFGYFDPHFAAKILHHIAKGVSASHREGVIHRDLKPSNIMVSAGVELSNLKITDFGIATLTEEVFEEAAKAGDLTQSTSGTIKGALPFMAPEMMFRQSDQKILPSVDIWSVGAMMFQLLTGDYPFGVYLEAAVNVKNKERKPWPKFMTRNPQFSLLSTELQAIVERCLDYNPESRLTADQLVELCDNLCYITAEREEGVVTNLIQNGYSGFATNESSDVFFSMESVYGLRVPDTEKNSLICYSSFSGSPKNRAHPIFVLKK
ncbi:serine/threonine protein kinase [Aquitalea magnusonii]|uniref:Serine/threonine protein kinase n=1 Tax=Aquitalea magnusonii TaxID=332411 RepID=A0A3G9GHD3_9NEIS|nr:serine/threonine-protein kinase [Aquitalea magnusonii]BBF87270.1 serine/threonine protein kinase [Aquitalea magnusonii]